MNCFCVDVLEEDIKCVYVYVVVIVIGKEFWCYVDGGVYNGIWYYGFWFVEF